MRDEILTYIKKELVGPDPIKPHIQSNGEEILINEPPRLRYGAGILFPRTATFEKVESTSSDENEVLESAENDSSKEDPVQAPLSQIQDKSFKEKEGFEEEIGLANSYLPSALGFSCFSIIPKEGFNVKIYAASYEIKDYSYQKVTDK